MSRRVLVIEDQEDNRQIMQDMLSHAGYEVLQATNGVDGVAMAENEKPDLILMDVMLPGIDGYEATRRIKAMPAMAQVPIFAVTSYAMDGEQQKALAAGCDEYFSKPFSPRAILARIRDYFDE